MTNVLGVLGENLLGEAPRPTALPVTFFPASRANLGSPRQSHVLLVAPNTTHNEHITEWVIEFSGQTTPISRVLYLYAKLRLA